MKKLLPTVLFICCWLSSHSQITSSVVKANFGIEADLQANFFNNAPAAQFDDWFKNDTTGKGDFVIDTSGAAAIVDGYITNPASRTRSFMRTMKVAPYSVMSRRLVLDAVYHRDYHGDDSTVFASGSNKNGMSPADWTSPVSQGIPDKNDILDAFTHVRRDGLNVTDSLWMFGGISIENTTGSRYFDFELYQTDFRYNKLTQLFESYGPDAGHTSWKFDAAGKILSPGDIIFTAEYGGADLKLIEARIWVDRAALSITPAGFNWGGAFDGASNSSRFGYANILPKTAGSFYTGIQSAAPATWAGPFSLVRTDNSVVTDYMPKQFMEFSVNLTKLGIEPSTFSDNPCGSPFRRVFIKTRSSASFSSELKDFVAPYRVFDYPNVDADTYITYFCGRMPDSVQVHVLNPTATSIYNWTTPNGTIIGSTTGPSIYVNAPGTYYVSQQLHAQCPVFSQDSVRIIFNAHCTILNLDITSFTANREGEQVNLKWSVNNNDLVKSFRIEYNDDNIHFKELAFINASADKGQAYYSYSFRDNLKSATRYYRICAINMNSAVKYSKTISIGRQAPLTTLVIYPNPVVESATVFFESATVQVILLHLEDANGKMISSTSYQVSKGSNKLPVPLVNGLADGIYLLKLVSGNSSITRKFTILH